MSVVNFGKFSNSFGLIKGPSEIVATSFLAWQQEILRAWGFELKMESLQENFDSALHLLSPRTAPIATKYLFWPLDENWTLYFDNGAGGTDAGPPCVLSSRIGVDSIRVVVADETVDSRSGKVAQYGATILEYYCNGVERRHIFAANDGGKWKFGEFGDPFPFENTAAYKAKSIKDRLTNAMLLGYLKDLDVKLDNARMPLDVNVAGYLLTKYGKMPATFTEIRD